VLPSAGLGCSATNPVEGNTGAQSNGPLSKYSREDLSAEKLISLLTEAVHSGNQPPLLSAIPRAVGRVKKYKLIFYKVVLIDPYLDQCGRLQKQNL
jgi:hypothetical protein